MSGAASCRPRLIVDGIRFPGDVPLNTLVSGDAIRAVEFYRDPLQAPGQFSIGRDMVKSEYGAPGLPTTSGFATLPPCAILVIWTDFGFNEFGP